MANSLFRLFWITLFIAVFLVVFLFGLMNADSVELNLFFYRYEVPLAALCWIFLFIGVVLGTAVTMFSNLGKRINKWAQS